MSKPYRKCVMGGTFDRLHEAHEQLLLAAVNVAEEIFIGIVGDTFGKKLFAKKELGEHIQLFNQRKANIEKFMNKHTQNYVIGELTDPWGPAPSDSEADVIVVSQETKEGAEKINEMRENNGLKLLDIIVVPVVYTNEGQVLSSTYLRKQEFPDS
jgi:pantetheine-phosphate adenylyltransferase